MIYFFYGSDSVKNTQKATKLVASLLQKKPDASYFKLDQEKFNKGTLEELLESSALFESRYIIYGSNIFSNKEYGEYLDEHIKRLESSPHIFILTEEKVSAPLLKKIKSHSEKIVEQIQPKTKKEFDQGLFALTDALGERDRKKTWKILHESYHKGATPEEVFNILTWQIKTLLIAKKLTKEGEALKLGIKSFPFSKAQRYTKNFKEEELQKLLKDFIGLFHESRLGRRELDLGMEYILLWL